MAKRNDARIAELKARIRKKKAEIAELEAEIERLNSPIYDLNWRQLQKIIAAAGYSSLEVADILGLEVA